MYWNSPYGYGAQPCSGPWNASYQHGVARYSAGQATDHHKRTFEEDLMQANLGKKVTVYLNYDGSQKWKDVTVRGTLKLQGRDFFVVTNDADNKDVMFLNINVNFVIFDQPIVPPAPPAPTPS